MAGGIELGPIGEGKFEADDTEDYTTSTISFDNPAFDPYDDPYEGGNAKDGYIEDDYIGSTIANPADQPPWARDEEFPPWLKEEDLAPNVVRDEILSRFISERSEFSQPANLKFAASTSGDLWVRWGVTGNS